MDKMNKLILVFVMSLACSSAQAGLISGFLQSIKKVGDEISTWIKTPEADVPVAKRETIASNSSGSKLADDLAFIESPNFRFTADDFLNGGDNLDNAFSPIPRSQGYIDFSNYVKLQMATKPFRVWASDSADQSNKEMTNLESNEKTLSNNQLNELISVELGQISDHDLYATNLAYFYSRLVAYGWQEFDPLKEYDQSKLRNASVMKQFTVMSNLFFLLETVGVEDSKIEENIKNNLVENFRSNDLLYLVYYFSGCYDLISKSPKNMGNISPKSQKIFDDLCAKEKIINASRRLLINKESSFVPVFMLESIPLFAFAQAQDFSNYYPLRDKMLSKIPNLLKSDKYDDASRELLTSIAESEILVGNLKNAYDISLLLLYEFGQDPKIRNRVLGYLMPAIFIEARDLVMTGKVLKMIKPMADVQSDFFIAAESKINLLTIIINYQRLIKEQTI